MMIRRVLTWGAVLVALTALLVMSASASHAEPKKLLVSSSASGPFQDNLATPLFDGVGRLVPRDQVAATFWVRNNSKQSARTTLTVVNRGGTSDFEKALSFQVDTDGTRSDGSVPDLGDDACTLVTTGPTIEPGETQAVRVDLQVADLPRQVGMRRTASLDVVVTLTQVGRQGQVDVCGAQAEAESPEVNGAQSDQHSGVGSCTDDVVVTLTGEPTCVPTAVDAGRGSYDDEPVRHPGVVASAAVIMLATGGFLLLLSRRSRRRS